MKQYVIDTNVLYRIIFGDGRCNVSRVLDLLNENVGIITYATLFEAFNKFKSDKTYIYDIMKFLTRYKIDIKLRLQTMLKIKKIKSYLGN